MAVADTQFYSDTQPRGSNGRWIKMGNLDPTLREGEPEGYRGTEHNPLPAGLTEPQLAELHVAVNGLADEARARNRAAKAEIIALAEATGGQVIGLDHSRKGKARMLQKAAEKVVKEGASPAEAAASISDALRFTIVYPDDTYARSAEQATARLLTHGFSVVEQKNYWQDPAVYRQVDYQGINMIWQWPSGLKAELQIHTQQSMHVKEVDTHPLYEQTRNMEPGDPGYWELRLAQERMFRGIPVPPGAPEVGVGAAYPSRNVLPAHPIPDEHLARLVAQGVAFRDVTGEPRDDHGRWVEHGGASDGSGSAGDVSWEQDPMVNAEVHTRQIAARLIAAGSDKEAEIAARTLRGYGVDPDRVMHSATPPSGEKADVPGAGTKGVRDSPVSMFGLTYDQVTADSTAVTDARAWDHWDNLPTVDLSLDQPIIATEQALASYSVDKVANGSEPIREGYFVQVMMNDRGVPVIIDGHHRFGIYKQKGLHSIPAKILPGPLPKRKTAKVTADPNALFPVDAPDQAALFEARQADGQFYSESQARDDHGRWAETGAGGSGSDSGGPAKTTTDGQIPVEEINRIQDQDGPPVKARDADHAVAELLDGHKVELQNSGDVAIMLDKIREVVKAAQKAGRDAPDINLCHVTIKGSSLFCVGNKGIPRIKMPQFSGIPIPGSKAAKLATGDGEVNIQAQFKQHLIDSGVKITDTDVAASHLKATQNELVGAKVAGIADAIESGEMEPGTGDRLFVSKDGYVVDGHHRWAATLGVDSRDGKMGDITMPVSVVDMDIFDILKASNAFVTDWGLPPKAGKGAAAMTTAQAWAARRLAAQGVTPARARHMATFSADQPRRPKGDPHGGEWVDEGGGPGASIGGISMVKLTDIVPENNDRKSSFGDLEGLSKSIEQSGLAQPITIRPRPEHMGEGPPYVIVAGERRWRASKLLAERGGPDEIKAIVKEMTDREASDVMLAENVARADLNPMDEAEAYGSRMEKYGMTADELAAATGLSAHRIKVYLPMLRLAPELKDLARKGQLSLGQAEALTNVAGVPLDHNRQIMAVRAMQEQDLNVAQLRHVVAKLMDEQNQGAMFDSNNFMKVEEWSKEAKVKRVTKKQMVSTLEDLASALAAHEPNHPAVKAAESILYPDGKTRIKVKGKEPVKTTPRRKPGAPKAKPPVQVPQSLVAAGPAPTGRPEADIEFELLSTLEELYRALRAIDHTDPVLDAAQEVIDPYGDVLNARVAAATAQAAAVFATIRAEEALA